MGRTTQWAERSGRSKGRGERWTGRRITLAALRRDYVYSTRERLSRLANALSDGRMAPSDEGLRDLARHLANRLRCMATSFETEEVGWAAGVIEDLLAREIDETTEDGSECERWARIELALAHARRTVEDAIRVVEGSGCEDGGRE